MSRTLLERLGENRRIWNGFYRHSRTFSLAARLLPRPVRMPVATLYLLCRRVDTIADGRAAEIGPERALRELHATERALRETLAGRPPEGMLWQRLAQVHTAYALRPGPLHELIAGARWDLDGRPIADEADLIGYANLVGGSVGAMMLPFLTGDSSAHERLETPARALGIAMQITNIIRDVGEDARELERVYLPHTWLDEHGLSPADLRCDRPGVPAAYPALLERTMRTAEAYYARSAAGIAALPLKARTGIRAAARMYREIMNEVRALDYDNLSRRAYVPLGRKLHLILHDGYARRKDRLLA